MSVNNTPAFYKKYKILLWLSAFGLGFLLMYLFINRKNKFLEWPVPNAYQTKNAAAFNTAQTDIIKYQSNPNIQRRLFNAYTINMATLNTFITNTPGAVSFRVSNALPINNPTNPASERLCLISAIGNNNRVIQTSNIITQSATDLCPNLCDINLGGAGGIGNLANSIQFATGRTYATNYQNRIAMYDAYKGFIVQKGVYEALRANANVKAIRIYNSLNASNQRGIYIFGVDNTGQIITGTFYYQDQTSLCPICCDII